MTRPQFKVVGAFKLVKGTQDYGTTVLGTLLNRKVRAKVHVDTSYPSQGHLTVEVWEGTKWNEVLTWPGQLFTNDLPGAYAASDGMKLSALATLIEKAMEEAAWVLG